MDGEQRVSCPYMIRNLGENVLNYRGSSILCNNYDCSQNDGQRLLVEGEGDPLGLCTKDGMLTHDEVERVPLTISARTANAA